MPRFLLLMHDDTTTPEDTDAWSGYLTGLRRRGQLDGGSSIGDGVVRRKHGVAGPLSERLVGYLFVQADSLRTAGALVDGNPVYEAGGTVEIRELVEDGDSAEPIVADT